jgi:hypothetical protein
VNSKLNFRKCVLEPFFNETDCQVGYVNAYPFPSQFFCGVNCRATSTERVKDNIPGLTACLDDPLKKGKRFLCRIPKALFAGRDDIGDTPDIIYLAV